MLSCRYLSKMKSNFRWKQGLLGSIRLLRGRFVPQVHMKHVVAYCRSANEPPDEPSAVRSQSDAICDYADRRGLTLGSIYADAGVSGVTLDRPALQQLIADCRAGKIGAVITKDPDRLSRDTRQLIALLHIFRSTGVRAEYSTRRRSRRYAPRKRLVSGGRPR
jgi:DNA invertase Pin-like site-specific DNA recombinase